LQNNSQKRASTAWETKKHEFAALAGKLGNAGAGRPTRSPQFNCLPTGVKDCSNNNRLNWMTGFRRIGWRQYNCHSRTLKESTMAPVDLMQLLRSQPFVPFRIQVSDGTAYEIRHPELVMVGLRSVSIGIPGANQPQPVYERVETVLLADVVKLLPVEAVKTAENGE
jgi:hypothetical protein